MARKLDRFQVRADLLENGVIQYGNERWVKGMLAQYEPCALNVIFERRKSNRSREQLAYLWGVVYPEISLHTGHSPEELHEIFKIKLLKDKLTWRGTEMFVVGSTSRCSVGEMSEFIMNVIAEASEMGIAVPDADPLYQFRKE